MRTGWGEKVREVADRDYVKPARAHRNAIQIRLGDLQRKMQELGLPQQNTNQVASALETPKFWDARGLEMCSPKGLSRKVDSVFEFRFIEADFHSSDADADPLLDLAGILKGALCEGVDTFIRNIRMDKEQAS
jgi:hypothetical protein